MRFLNAIGGAPTGNYACSVKSYVTFSAINGVLMWLYLPLIFVLFGVHVYLVHIDGAFPMLIIVVPLSTWFFQLTGKICLGALLNALIVTWMFVSSQVVAPIPV
jgi:hypothetical protein